MVSFNISLSDDTKNDIKQGINECVIWYKEQYKRFRTLLKEEMTNQLIDGLCDNFGAKLDLFCVYDILLKYILCHYSAGLPDCYNAKGQTRDNWLDCHLDFNDLSEILNLLFTENNEGENIDLSVAYEDRNVRSALTHSGRISKCLSAIRLYNIVRDMILFLAPEYSSDLPKFDYPKEFVFDIQELLNYTDNFNSDDITMVLVANSMHDVPEYHKSVLANCKWDIVIDFDSRTENGGLFSAVKHHNYRKVSADISVAKSEPLSKGFTTWFKVSDNLSLTKHDRLKNLSPDFSINMRDRNNKLEAFYKGLFVDNLLRSREAPIIVVSLKPYDTGLTGGLIRSIGNNFDDFKFIFINTHEKDKTENMLRDFFDGNGLIYEDHCRQYNVPIHKFTESMYLYRDSFGKVLKSQSIEMPSDDGYKPVNQNLYTNTSDFFELLHTDIGKEDNWQDAVNKFYHGEEASWSVFYNSQLVEIIDSDVYKNKLIRIKKILSRIPDNLQDKIFYLEHSAGIGGTTLLKKIAWDLHLEVPVLRLKKYRKASIKDTIRDFYDNHTRSGILVIADEANFSETELSDLKRDIIYSERRCALIIAMRSRGNNHENIDNIIPLYSIVTSAIDKLRKQFKNYSDLDKKTIEQKDANFEFVFSDKSLRCPFIIGLYYIDIKFNGVNTYVEKIIDKITNKDELEVISIIALCNYYGRTGLPIKVVQDKLKIKQDYLKTHPYATDIFYKAINDGTSIYISKHPLLSKCLLDECSNTLYGGEHREYLDKLSKLIIDCIIYECQGIVQDIYADIFEAIFISKNVLIDETEGQINAGFSLLIETVKTPEVKEIIISYLVKEFEKVVLNLDKTDEVNFKAYMSLAHFYGHLSRIHSKSSIGLTNEKIAIEDCENAYKYMIAIKKKDAYIYHMYGIALANFCRKIINNQSSDTSLTEEESSLLETYLKQSIEMFNEVSDQGSIDYAVLSKLDICITYLKFIYALRKIDSCKQFSKLSTFQLQIKNDIETLFSQIDGVELSKSARRLIAKLDNLYSSNLMFGDYSSAIQYYQNRIDVLKDISGAESEMIAASYGLVNAILGNYKSKSKSDIYFDEITNNDIDRVLSILENIMEYSFDVNNYRERHQRIFVIKRWLKLAKYSSRNVQYAITIVDKWCDIEQKYKSYNPLPYYYAYVLHFLKALDGYDGELQESEKYKRITYNLATKENSPYFTDTRYMHDIVLKGTGVNRLKDITYLSGKVSDILTSNDLLEFRGKLIKSEADKGIVSLYYPLAIKGTLAKITLGEGNSVKKGQIGHKLAFFAGFSFEQLIAIDSSVVDLDIGESLEERVRQYQTKNLTQTGEYKEVIKNSNTSTNISKLEYEINLLIEKDFNINNDNADRVFEIVKGGIYFGTLESTRYSKQYPDCSKFMIKYKFGYVPVSIKKTEIVSGVLYDESLQKLKGINVPIYIINEGYAGGPVIGSIKKALAELRKISD